LRIEEKDPILPRLDGMAMMDSTMPTTIKAPSLWRRLLRGYRKLRQSQDWESFAGADWPVRIMTEEVTDRFHAKQGRTIGRWSLTAADGRQLVVYLKRHYKLPRLDGLLAALFPSKARSPGLQEWEHLTWAEKQGLPVPRAVAAGEIVGPRGKLQSFLAVEELTGMLALHEAIPLAQSHLDRTTFAKWKRTLAREMARLSRLLHDRSAFHKDLYLCHFYIREEDAKRLPGDWRYRVVVIDLHRLARHRLASFWFKAKDLAQLHYSSEVPGVTDRDRLAFWRAYQGGKQHRILARLIRMKSKQYRRHNAKRSPTA
jgi:hypothetical protein